MTNKKKVVVVGNCQARPIATLLEAMSDEVEVTKVAIVHLLSSDQEAEYKPFFEEADYIIAQLVAPNYPCEFVCTDFLEKSYNNKLVKIVNLFYKVDHPDWIYIRDENRNHLSGILSEYHNLTILKSWFLGRTILETKFYLNNKKYNQLEFESIQKNSMKQLKLKESSADVKITDFIENKKNLFWTFNHPKNELLFEYTNRILEKIIDHKAESIELENESLGKVKLPVIINNFDKSSELNGFVIGNKEYKVEKVIESFFSLYNDNKAVATNYIKELIKLESKLMTKAHNFSFCGFPYLAKPIPVNTFTKEIFIQVENDFLHLSNVLFEINGKWHDLQSDLISDLKQSSVQLDQSKFSVSSLIKHQAKFFSTKREAKAYLNISFSESVIVTKIKVINRPEYSLWKRTNNLRIVCENRNEDIIVFDNKNIFNIKSVLSDTLLELEKSNALKFLKGDLELIRLYLEDLNNSNRYGFFRAVLSLVNQVYILIVKDIKGFYELKSEIKPLIELLANVECLIENKESTTVLIAYLILENKSKDAFSIYKNICHLWISEDVEQLKAVVNVVGQFKFGHSLVPASHSFARPIRDWPKKLVLNTIDIIIESTKVEDVICSFICYGTLLGLYRDKDFIAHDDDVDLLCIVKNGLDNIHKQAEVIKNNLVEQGLKVRVAITNDKNKLPFLMIFDPSHGIHSDLFFAYTTSDEIYLPMVNVKYSAIEKKEVLPLSTYSIWGREFEVPKNIEYFLEKRYGESWNIADEFFRGKEK